MSFIKWENGATSSWGLQSGVVGRFNCIYWTYLLLKSTKINIDYFLDEIMDANHISEIFEHFNLAKTDKIEAALEDLGEDDYSETEVRLVRVKFLPDIGN